MRGGTANMDVLVALGTSVAYGFSAVALFQGLHLYGRRLRHAPVSGRALVGDFLQEQGTADRRVRPASRWSPAQPAPSSRPRRADWVVCSPRDRPVVRMCVSPWCVRLVR